MPTQLQSARSHYERQQRITAGAVRTAREAQDAPPSRLAAIVALFQALAARDAIDAVPQMLAEQDIPATSPLRVLWQAVTGVASDGRPLESLMAQAQTPAQLDMIVSTQIQDAARVAGGLAITVRPQVAGYVRMLNPPSCSRCAVLAGAFYRWNAGFERHPSCDCRHIPANEDAAGDLVSDPEAYFESLSAAEQNKTFTKAGAQAIRDGADISQVVNARRGMDKAARSTTAGSRRSRRRPMPEAIYEQADGDRDKAMALLKRHGYLI